MKKYMVYFYFFNHNKEKKFDGVEVIATSQKSSIHQAAIKKAEFYGIYNISITEYFSN